MRHILSRTVFTLTALALCHVASAQNLLTNGSFDGAAIDGGSGTTIPTGWTRYDSNQSYVVADPGGNAVDGPNYLQLGAFAALGQVTPTQIAPATPYNIAAFARSFGGGPYDVRVYANTLQTDRPSDGVLLATLQFTPDTNTMTELSTQFTPAGSEAGKFLGVYVAAHANFYGFDNVRLTAVPEPASLAGLAGGVLLLVRRRRNV